MNHGIRIRIEPKLIIDRIPKDEFCQIVDVRGKSKRLQNAMKISSAFIVEPENLLHLSTEWDKTKSYYLYCA